MKSFALLILSLIFVISAAAQNIISTSPARLQVVAVSQDGTQHEMISESLYISYDRLQMTGELMLNTLSTVDGSLRNLLDSAINDRITFKGLIPEGQFVFQSTLEERSTVETELFYGEKQSKILLDLEISNHKTSLANTFDITGRGSISLRDDLGVTHLTDLEDKISFQFFQNVMTRTY